MVISFSSAIPLRKTSRSPENSCQTSSASAARKSARPVGRSASVILLPDGFSLFFGAVSVHSVSNLLRDNAAVACGHREFLLDLMAGCFYRVWHWNHIRGRLAPQQSAELICVRRR